MHFPMLRKVRQAQEDEIRGGCHRKNMRLIHSFVGDRNRSNMHAKQAKLIGTTRDQSTLFVLFYQKNDDLINLQ